MSCPTIKQIRDGQSFHAGKVHEAVIRELDERVVKRLDAQDLALQEISAQVETLRRIIVGTT